MRSFALSCKGLFTLKNYLIVIQCKYRKKEVNETKFKFLSGLQIFSRFGVLSSLVIMGKAVTEGSASIAGCEGATPRHNVFTTGIIYKFIHAC
jgi:hypothetical protein